MVTPTHFQGRKYSLFFASIAFLYQTTRTRLARTEFVPVMLQVRVITDVGANAACIYLSGMFVSYLKCF